jgi:hypothetical protein
MFRYYYVALLSSTSVLILLGNLACVEAAQPFSWKTLSRVNTQSNHGAKYQAWRRASTGRLTLNQPSSHSAQGRKRLAPSTDPKGKLQLQPQSSSSRKLSNQQRVEQLIQQQINKDKAERARRKKIVERMLNQPAETTVMPLNSGKPQPVTVMPLDTGKPEPVTVMPLDEEPSKKEKRSKNKV